MCNIRMISISILFIGGPVSFNVKIDTRPPLATKGLEHPNVSQAVNVRNYHSEERHSPGWRSTRSYHSEERRSSDNRSSRHFESERKLSADNSKGRQHTPVKLEVRRSPVLRSSCERGQFVTRTTTTTTENQQINNGDFRSICFHIHLF